MVALLKKPRPQTRLSLMYREHLELLEHLAPEEKTRVICCAAKLINYFDRWQTWKKKFYPTEWVYQPLRDIYHDLFKEHSIHVIREAIALLERLGFLSRRTNDRATNRRNGQEKTHQYYLHSDRIKQALKNVFGGSETESLDDTAESVIDSTKFYVEIREFNVETYTQIPSTDSCTDSCSLSEEREKLEVLTKEEEEENSQEEDVITDSLVKTQDSINVLQQSKDSGLDKCSAPMQLKKHQNDLPTPEGWNDFYPQLLEYARREGKASPAGWTSAVSRHILEELAAGRPHCFWDDFQQGVPLGFQELKDREWINPKTGEPWPIFVKVLIDHCQNDKWDRNKPGMTATAQAADILAKPKKAAMMWAKFKHLVIRLNEDWQRQKELGVQSPALPPAFASRQEPSLMEAAEAMQSIMPATKANLPLPEEVTAPEEVAALPPTQADLSPVVVQQASLPLPAVEPETEPEPEPVQIADLQEKLNMPVHAPFVRMMAVQWGYRIDDGLVLPVSGEPSVEHLRSLLANPITAPKAQRLIEANPSWGFLIDREGQLYEYEF